MNKLQKDIIALLKSSITGKKEILSADFNMAEVINIARLHAIEQLIYIGAINSGIPKTDPAMLMLFNTYCQIILLNERQMSAVEELYRLFEEDGISYMPVKGCNMKSLYPNPEMRLMGDADILIKEEDYSGIEKIMQELCFTFNKKSNHDYVWTSDRLEVELHFKLITTYNNAYEDYFGNGWKLASYNNGNRYYMTKEDEFIYNFIHFTKHYRNGGIGLRHVVDLWVYLIHNKAMDYKYIDAVMEKLSVREFYHNVMRLIEVWFNNEEPNEITDMITDFIFSSGTWGNNENIALARTVKVVQEKNTNASDKLALIKNLAFPMDGEMEMRYPILKKSPYLLPFMWVKRWSDVNKRNPEKVKQFYKLLSKGKNEEINQYEKNMKKVGLSFKFK